MPAIVMLFHKLYCEPRERYDVVTESFAYYIAFLAYYYNPLISSDHRPGKGGATN